MQDKPSHLLSDYLAALCSDLPQPAATLKPFTSPRDSVVADHAHRKLKQKNAYDKHASATLSALPLGSYVYSRPQLISTSKAWILGKIVGHAAPRSYLINTGKSQIRRNSVQVQLAFPRSDSSKSSFNNRAEPTLPDQLLLNSLTVTSPISQTTARSTESPPSPASATPASPAPDETHMESSPRCAMLSPTPPLVSPVLPSPSLPKSNSYS